MTEIDYEQCGEGTEQPYVPYTDVACFFAIKLENLDWLRDTILKHSPQAQYLLTGEIATESHKHSDGEHIHCYWKTTDDDTGYDAIRNAVKRKFKLVGKAKENSGRQYGKIMKVRDAEKLKIYMMKEQNLDMVRTNCHKKEELLQYMLLSYKKVKNQQKWAKLQAFAHKLMKKYQEKYDTKCETYYAHNYDDPDPVSWRPSPQFPKLQLLGELNDFYLKLNDGIPLAKNSLIRISFELGILKSEEYVYNQLKFIMFS